MVKLYLEEGCLGHEKLLQKSQELDELLNSFYDPRGLAARTGTAGDLITAALNKISLIDEDRVLKIRKLCARIGREICLRPQQRCKLDLLARMNNLGMLAVPRHILDKKEPLTETELSTLRRYPENGYHIALCLESLSGVADLILNHREHWDGSGYPRGLSREEIPLECRVFAIVEAYCIMTGSRPRRLIRSNNEALTELKHCSGSQFDPWLVSVFCKVAVCESDK